MYYSVLNIGLNEFGPVNGSEMLFLVLTLISSAFMNALIFSDVAVQISTLSRKTQEYQKTLDETNTVMKDVELNEGLQEEIRDFFQKTIHTKQKQEEYDIFLDMIAPSLQIKVQNSIFIGVLIKNKPIIKVITFMIHNHIESLKSNSLY